MDGSNIHANFRTRYIKTSSFFPPKKLYNSFPTGREFLQHNRFGSFAPERTNQVGQYFIDGQNYMSAVADAILAATEEIYIADWWLSPEIYLKRGSEFDEKFRLDRLLKKKAVSGKSEKVWKGFFFKVLISLLG